MVAVTTDPAPSQGYCLARATVKRGTYQARGTRAAQSEISASICGAKHQCKNKIAGCHDPQILDLDGEDRLMMNEHG